MLAALVFAMPVLGYWYTTTILHWDSLLAIFIAFTAMATTFLASRYFMRPFMTEFRGFVRVRDLAYTLVAQEPQLLGSAQATWTSEEVWSLLSAVVRAETGVTEFTKDSRVVADLGID
jgi:hypothetical protein